MVESEETEARIEAAVKALEAGQLVAFPTETVYGLGCDASNPNALELLYKVKGRPAGHPCIVHLASPEQVGDWATDIPQEAQLLADIFWPGPLTLVLKKHPRVPDQVSGGQPTIALRIPDHVMALKLLDRFGHGIAAPSANRFGRLSATCADDVKEEFGPEVPVVLDGGACQVGIESTIVDVSGPRPAILRPGMILKESIDVALEAVGQSLADPAPASPRVPGSLPKHYAPRTPVKLVEPEALDSQVAELEKEGQRPAVLSFQKPPVDHAHWIVTSHFPQTYAHRLYRELKRLDRSDYDLIVIERPPAEPEWTAIHDRLSRAAGMYPSQGDPVNGG